MFKFHVISFSLSESIRNCTVTGIGCGHQEEISTFHDKIINAMIVSMEKHILCQNNTSTYRVGMLKWIMLVKNHYYGTIFGHNVTSQLPVLFMILCENVDLHTTISYVLLKKKN